MNFAVPHSNTSSGYFHTVIRDSYETIQNGFPLINNRDRIVNELSAIHRRSTGTRYICIGEHGDPGATENAGYHLHIIWYHYPNCSTSHFLRNEQFHPDGLSRQFKLATTRVRCIYCVFQYLQKDITKHILYNSEEDSSSRGILFSNIGNQEGIICSYHKNIRDEGSLPEDGQHYDQGSGLDDMCRDAVSTRGENPQAAGESPRQTALRLASKYVSPDLATFRRAVMASGDRESFLLKQSKTFQEMVKTYHVLAQEQVAQGRWLDCMNKWSPEVSNLLYSRKYDDIEKSIETFEYLMKYNNLKIVDFVNDVYTFMNLDKPKKRCMYLYGPKNCGKSMIANSIAQTVMFTKIGNVKGKADQLKFTFQPLIQSRCAVFDEVCIIDDTLEIWLNLFEGGQMWTDVKNSNHERLPDIPILVTSNYPVGYHLSPSSQSISKPALYARMNYYVMNTCEYLKDVNQFHPDMWVHLINKYVKQ